MVLKTSGTDTEEIRRTTECHRVNSSFLCDTLCLLCGPIPIGPLCNKKIKIYIPIVLLSFLLSCTGKNEAGKASTNTQSSGPQTESANPLISVYEAALNGQISIVNVHLEKGTDVNLPDEEGRTPLMYASYNGHTDVIKKLIEKGANVNIQDPFGRTALMMAASGPFPETVKVLLDSGADPNLTDKDEHFTALMYAASEGQLEVVKLLLVYKSDPAMKDIDGDDASVFAQKNNHPEVSTLLRSIITK